MQENYLMKMSRHKKGILEKATWGVDVNYSLLSNLCTSLVLGLLGYQWVTIYRYCRTEMR